MSKFFAAGSSSESESESSEEEVQVKQQKTTAGSRFLRDESSSDEEHVKRVVRSAKDKRFDAMTSVIKSMRNHIKINDWNAIANDFDELNKQLAKANQITAKEGIPRFYIKALVTLEDFIKATSENADAKKKMSPTNAKSFNTMKQKLKKHNKPYEADIEKYRANPDKDESESESDSDSEEESEKSESEESEKSDKSDKSDSESSSSEEPAPKPAEKKGISKWLKKPAAEKSSSSESDDDWSGSDEESDEDEEGQQVSKASRWLKKADSDDERGKKGKKDKKDKKKVEKKPAKKVLSDAEGDELDDDGFEKVGGPPKKPQLKAEELTPEAIDKRLKEIVANRGKKGTDRYGQIEELKVLVQAAKGPVKQLEVLVHLVASHFDAMPILATFLPIPLWKGCYKFIIAMLDLLEANPQVTLHDEHQVVAAQTSVFDEEDVERGAGDGDEGEPAKVAGNLLAFLERLDDEMFRSLQFIESHTQDYIQRLVDEPSLMALAERVQRYYERIGNLGAASRIAARRIEHLYFKLVRDDKANPVDEKDEINAPVLAAVTASAEANAVVARLAKLVYEHGDERIRTRTILCHTYHHALHNRYTEARDMLLMSHLQDSIQHQDISTQILFNRMMVQLGMCAFRHGLVWEAHSALADICSSGRVKELLAQGFTTSRYDKNPEQEKAERKRQMPYHMHINLDLLECFHLTCAMLLEVPAMAASPYDTKRKVISKALRRVLDAAEKNGNAGPPENIRDHIVAATRALGKGDWKKCYELITKLPIWRLVQNADTVKANLLRRIQEEGLRTYLLTYGRFYDALSLEPLAAMFELPEASVHALLSKMMINEELNASHEQPTHAVLMHRVEPSRMQFLALQFADKASVVVENNERLVQPGGFAGKYDREGGRDGKAQGGKGEYRDRQDRDRGDRGNFRGRGGWRGGDREGGYRDRGQWGDRDRDRDRENYGNFGARRQGGGFGGNNPGNFQGGAGGYARSGEQRPGRMGYGTATFGGRYGFAAGAASRATDFGAARRTTTGLVIP
eukprot:tig00000842_g4832.t1